MNAKGIHALALARAGFRVFPLKPNGKTPAIKDFPNLATTDEAQIARWWAKRDYNIGVATGRGLIVLDYDMKPGQHGAKSLAMHDMLGLPDSHRTQTASGGLHVYFRTDPDDPIPNSASKLAANVDVRGEGGFVVGPGSSVDGKEYSSLDDNPPDTIPDWIRTLATARRTKSSVDPSGSLVELDAPEAVARAIAYLRDDAPEAVEGAGGDTTTFKVACQVRDFGLSQSTAYELLAEHWNEGKASPAWSPDELEAKVRNAYSYATLPAGVSNARAEFDAVDLLEEEDTPSKADAGKKSSLFLVSFDRAADDALSVMGDPLIKTLFNTSALSVVYGRSNTGKSYVVLNMAFHIAAGLPWYGKKVKQGAVVYVAAEGGRGMYKRLAAIRRAHSAPDGLPLYLVPCPINLLKGGPNNDTAKLIALIQEAEATAGQKVELVVIDTLSRALAGGDENASTDMGAFVMHVDKLRAATKAHVLIVHHSGKDQARGARGWSGIQAAVDTEIEVHKEPGATAGKISITKQRDIEPIEPLAFSLRPVRIGKDEDGDDVTAATVEISQASAEEFGQEQATRAELRLAKFIYSLACHKATKEDSEKDFSEIPFRPADIEKAVKNWSQEFDTEGGLELPGVSNVRRDMSALCQKGFLRKDETNQYFAIVRVND